jgi:hypothetical protein
MTTMVISVIILLMMITVIVMIAENTIIMIAIMAKTTGEMKDGDVMMSKTMHKLFQA